MPTWPDPVKIRSAIIIVETEVGETMQALLTPEWWQPVEATMVVDYETDLSEARRPIWTITLVAGGYHGQFRTTGATAEQVGPRAVES